MWAYESIFYQIYTLGFCDAPKENDGILKDRILKVKEWIPHLSKLGIDAIYFSPIFESDRHGYDTRDYKKLDCRLGTNENFKEVCEALHKNHIRVVLDGVFNHVGRGFWAFQDVLKQKERSPYKDWFFINFGGNSNYNDGLAYEGWEGHFELVKLNLQNEAVVQYLLDCIKFWIEAFDIDGLRLDVAYSLSYDFLKRLRTYCTALKEDFVLIGEIMHGDYTTRVNSEMLHSCTNYECHKGIYSSLNDQNLFEIAHSLNRQFGGDTWALYRGKHLLSFVDNHDVTRLKSKVKNEAHVKLAYAILFGMPGIPCLYYGSEWGAEGEKTKNSDDALRPSFEKPEWNELTDYIKALIEARKANKVLVYGDFSSLMIRNKEWIFRRAYEGEEIIVALNIGEDDYITSVQSHGNQAVDLITKVPYALKEACTLKGYSALYLEVK